MKITSAKKSQKITAAVKIVSKDDLEQAIKDTLDDDMCEAIVDAAYSEDNTFEDDYFFDMDTFLDIISNEEPYEILRMFWYGEDLDNTRGPDTPANPMEDYARYDRVGNVETTNYPGNVYYNELLNEIVDYVMDHLDDGIEYPEEIQELINQYLGYMEEQDDSEGE